MSSEELPRTDTSSSITHQPKSRPSADEAMGSAQPRKKRKQRQQFSCAECRRLKLKCDRQIPCANCVRRACGHLCPEKERRQGNTESTGLLSRLENLEGVLLSHGIPLPTTEQPGSLKSQPTSSNHPSLGNQSPSSFSSDSARAPKTFTAHPPSQNPLPVPSPLQQVTEARLSELADAAAQMNEGSSSTPTFAIAQLPPQPEINHVHFDFSDPSSSSFGSVPIPVLPAQPMSPENQSYGTLMLSEGGRSKYLGPTAASEWLKDQECTDPTESPSASRYPSPERQGPAIAAQEAQTSALFPFKGQHQSMESLIAKLPSMDEGSIMIDSYYRYFAWHYNVAPRERFQPIFNAAYQELHGASHGTGNRRIKPQELALVFSVLAMGALHNLELRPNDPCAEVYCALAKACLAKGDFLVHTTLAGIQALHIMAHYFLETERGRNGDAAWPLWGIAMRLIQAMGIHRDGARWNLPEEVVEERRRVFWECNTADIFQANCFSRPCTMSPDYIDTAFPASTGPPFEKDFYTLKFELTQVSVAILSHAMKVKPTPYHTVTELHQRLCEFEKQVPYRLRSRAALLAMPSVYADPAAAIRDSPQALKGNLVLTLQQSTLAINLSETFLFLHRPYYARALHDGSQDPTKSPFGPSFLAVVERCQVIINVVTSLYSIHPNVCARHWFLWYHAFNCAVCLGTLIFSSPQNALATFALSQIDATVSLYTSGVQGGASKRTVNNLRWLLRLRAQAARKIEKAVGGQSVAQSTTYDVGSDSEDENIELIGWRTRLIERVSKGGQTAKTISQTTPSASAATESPTADVNDTISVALQQLLGTSDLVSAHEGQQSSAGMDNESSDFFGNSTNDLLHQFWDPLMLQDIPETSGQPTSGANWWEWDAGMGMDTNVGSA
ncbi:hypothetical protein I302_107233 [Kwoniella bestiolae CBS 10118]|uniref:Zn(2)-C6 fungal-type domain-containing protein n=1 Tax=Kwoniella bestiolae CBS 10118 TaxID=1296100 RepID=A0AAJ8KD86_9TREE